MKFIFTLLSILLFFYTSNSQNVKWANVYGSSLNDFVYFSIANDGNGNVYNTGSFSGTATFGAFKLTSTGGVDNYVQKVRPDGSSEWCNKIGGTVDEGAYNSITVDCNNNIFVTGAFSGTCTFNGTNNSSFTLTSTGSYDAYIIKYNPQGVILDAKRIITGSGEEKPFKIITDNECNIYITGSYGGNSGASATFGSISKSNSGVYDMFILKLNQSLNVLWVNTAGSAADDLGSYIAVDSSNNVYVVTQYWTTLSFSNTSTTLSHASGGNWDAALIKYNANGAFIWAQKFGSTGHETCNGISISKSGKIYWVGGYSGVTTFSSANGSTFSLTSNGSYDAVIIQYDLNGVLLKAKYFGGSGGDYFRGIALSKNQDSITVVGTYQNSVSFTSNTLSSVSGSNDAVLLVLDSACNSLVSYSYGGTAFEEATDLVCDNKNNIYLVGYFGNSMRFENKQITSYGNTDIFLAKVFNKDIVSDSCINCNSLQFNSLIACYPLNGTANDQTTNSLNGSGNGVTSATDRLNKSNACYSFDGNDEIDFTYNAFKLGTFSFSGWVYLDTVPTASNPNFTIFSIGGDTSAQTLSLNYVSANLSSFNFSSAGVNSNLTLSYGINPTIRQWYFICITRDSSKLTMYINQDTTISQNSTVSNIAKYNSSNYKCTFGSNRSTTNTFYRGRIDDIRIYNLPLSKTDVAKLYLASNGTIKVEAGENRTLCQGSSIALMASGAIDYSWSPSTGLNATNISNPIATPNITTTYYVSGTNGNCNSLDSVTVFVPPTFAISNSSFDSICFGDTVILTASSMRKQYLWSNGATTQSIKIAPTQTTTYSVIGRLECCKDTLYKTIYVKNTPVDAGNNMVKCNVQPVQLQATGAINYSWSPSSGLSSTTISNPLANPLITTTYYVVGTNGSCFTRDSVKVIVNPTFGIFGNSVDTICIKDSIIISATANRDSYNWSNGAKTSFIKVSPSVSSNYTVISTLNGCVDTATKSVVVINNAPKAGNDIYICGNKSAQLNATGSANYLWMPSLGLSDSAISNPIAKPLVTTTYILKGSTLNCIKYDTLTVFVNPSLTITASKDTLCLGDSILLQSSTANSYLWDNGSTSKNIYVQPQSSQTFRLIATLNGCTDTAYKSIYVISNAPKAGNDVYICGNKSAQLSASGSSNYLWIPSFGLSDSTISNPIAKPSSTTTYLLKGSTLNCVKYDTITVFVNPRLTIYASKDSICFGDSILLQSSNADSYLWDNGATSKNIYVRPQSNQTYRLIATLNGCTDTAFKTIFVTHVIVDAGANQTRCNTAPIQLLATGANNYIWSPNTGLNAINIGNPLANPGFTTTYYVTGYINGCSNTDSVTVFVNPPFNLLATNDTICRGDSVKIFASIGRNSYLWNTGSTSSFISVAPQTTTTYKVISSLNNCIDTLIKTIYVKTCLGIKPAKNKANISVYPNPAHDEINIKLPETGEMYSISLYSMDGKLISQIESNKSILRLNVKIASGIYLLNVKSANTYYTEKIILE